MPRPVTLFTGQFADLPFEKVAQLASEWGYDGLEIACWGDHFEVDKAVADPSYVQGRREILDRHGLSSGVTRTSSRTTCSSSPTASPPMTA